MAARLKPRFTLSFGEVGLCLDLVALDETRCATLVTRTDPTSERVRRLHTLLLFDGERAMHRFELDELAPPAENEHIREVTLFRSGEAFGVATPRAVLRWRSFDGSPEHFSIAPLPVDAFGRTWAPWSGGVSDEEDVVALTVHEPGDQSGAQRIGTLKLEAGRAAWRELDASGVPPTLDKADFPLLPHDHNRPEPVAPFLSAAAWLGGRRLAYTFGMSANPTKWTPSFAMLVALDGAGRATTLLAPDDVKLRAKFSSDGRALLLTPLVGSSPWKDKARAFDLERAEYLDLPLKKRMSPLDLVGDVCWVHEPGPRGGTYSAYAQ